MPELESLPPVFNPRGLELVRVAGYERTIRASIERVWENVRDWEHLPHLHQGSFSYVELVSASDKGWQVWSNRGRTSHIELSIADSHSYVSRSFRRGEQMSEIWTVLEPRGQHTAIEVTFHVPAKAAGEQERTGQQLLDLYKILWDQDEAMMIRRQQQLDVRRLRGVNTTREVNLGKADAIVLPQTIQLGGNEFLLRSHKGELVIHGAVCPHLLGPLEDSAINDGIITCPWHGYQFEVSSGRCVSPATASCRLPAPPTISRIEDDIIVRC